MSDVVTIGDATLYLGDCRDILPTLPAGSVDAVVTDPPFGIGFKYDEHVDSEAGYEALMSDVVPLAERCVRDGGSLFWWQGMLRASDWHKWFPPGFRIMASCKNFVQMRPTAIQFSFDPVIFWSKGKPTIEPQDGRRDWHIANTAKWVCDKATKGLHPCQRPLDAAEHVVFCASDEGALILDPFMGAATTGVACLKSGRRFVGIEKSAEYFETACRRIREAVDANERSLFPVRYEHQTLPLEVA